MCAARIKGAKSARWSAVVSWHYQKHWQGRRPGSWQLQPQTVLKSVCPHVFVFMRDINSLHMHLSSVALDTPKRYSQGTTFISQNSPIRCALVAHDDDLGVFIATRLNIYFSAQGEAEKKNVSPRGSTSGGFNTVSPPLHAADVYKTSYLRWHPRNHGIHGWLHVSI